MRNSFFFTMLTRYMFFNYIKQPNYTQKINVVSRARFTIMTLLEFTTKTHYCTALAKILNLEHQILQFSILNVSLKYTKKTGFWKFLFWFVFVLFLSKEIKEQCGKKSCRKAMRTATCRKQSYFLAKFIRKPEVGLRPIDATHCIR